MTDLLCSHDGNGVVYVIEEQSNPSSDYFIRPTFSGAGFQIIRCGANDQPVSSDLVGAIVVFVRYVPSNWMRLVEVMRPQIRRLVFFMDDDLLDLYATVGMPLRYRMKLARFATWRANWLRKQDAELWVSTHWLQQKYVAWHPTLVLPSPVTPLQDVPRFFYHGSASHAAEIRWLRPVVEEVLRRDERLSFEIIGGEEVYRLYRNLPRVSVLHPMKWPAYQAFLAMPGRHIGLAPLLDLPFNQARSCTKFFDITRCGAVGIYSSNGACDEVVTHGVDGLLLPMDRQAWMDGVVRLASDGDLRVQMYRNAQSRQEELGRKALQNKAKWLERRVDIY